jgi:CheY-like chemotaxis protein
MSAKRALVVDDSKSARAFLSRLLEQYHLDVDTAESAEDAIDYLNRHRPDVIFMDHLMPGMDGFQAVQAIKNNPRTATIPILMYTSQEGELYLGQARALGAVGVLPKQIKPADVATVLYQLHLLEERRDAAASGRFRGPERRTGEQLVPAGARAADLEDTQDELPPLTQPVPTLRPARSAVAEEQDLQSLREELGELRRLVVTGLDQQTERLLEEVRVIVRDAQPPPLEAAITHRDWRGTLYGIAATLAAIVLAALWLRGEVERRSLQMQVAQLAAARTPPAAEAAVAAPAEAAPPPTVDAVRRPPAVPGAFPVPYGELPLAGARVERLRVLLNQLADSGFQGTVEVQAFPGRFCLAGNPSDGYSLAPDTTPVAQCELIGNPAEETLGAAQRESLPFANMVAEFRKAHGEAIELRLLSGSADQLVRPYPDAGGTGRTVTAGEWNAAAAANSRVDVRWRPRA